LYVLPHVLLIASRQHRHKSKSKSVCGSMSTVVLCSEQSIIGGLHSLPIVPWDSVGGILFKK